MSSSILHDCSTIIKGNAESFRQLSHPVHGEGARQETGTAHTPVGAIHESPASLPFYPSLPCAKGGGGVADGGIVTKLRDNPSVTCRLRMFFGFAREIVGVQPTKKNSARRCASRTAHPLHRGAESTCANCRAPSVSRCFCFCWRRPRRSALTKEKAGGRWPPLRCVIIFAPAAYPEIQRH